ncbi:MAG: TetR/AcrR family transcriptional regulator [Byssovorax sp.]
MVLTSLRANAIDTPLDDYTSALELFDQQTLVVVLGVAKHERKRAEPLAHVLESDARDVRAAFAQVHAFGLDAVRYDLVGEPKLPVELERARVNGDGPRRDAGAVLLVDDANRDTAPREASERGARSSAPGGKRWERRSDARPAEIVAAAERLFAERGFAATRMGDVAARAGITKATVYLYFEDKERLFETVVREAMAANLARAEALVDTYDGSSATLLRMLVTIFEGVLETNYTSIAKMIVAESASFPELAKLYVDLVLNRGFRVIEKIIQRGIERGEFRDVSPAAMVPVVMAPFLLLGMWKESLGKHSDLMPAPRAVLAEHVEVLLRGLARVD